MPTKQSPASAFGPLHIIEPTEAHTHTAIMLHGRGSTGEEFAEELSESQTSQQKSIFESLPSWRWVFPSSRMLWSSTFEENIPAWFEAVSLGDVNARQDLQSPGILESVRHIEAILEAETQKLGGNTEALVLGGISQGAAIAMWTLLCRPAQRARLGAFVGASTWLPFAANIKRVLGQPSAYTQGSSSELDHDGAAESFVERMMTGSGGALADFEARAGLLATPVFLGHGSDDAIIDLELGRQAKAVLAEIGFKVSWREYSNAEQEGHWLKIPEEVDDIVNHLISHS